MLYQTTKLHSPKACLCRQDLDETEGLRLLQREADNALQLLEPVQAARDVKVKGPRGFIRDQRDRMAAIELPKAVADAVSSALRGNDLVAALPMTKPQIRHSCPASMRTDIRNWLASDDGQAWTDERAALWQAMPLIKIPASSSAPSAFSAGGPEGAQDKGLAGKTGTNDLKQQSQSVKRSAGLQGPPAKPRKEVSESRAGQGPKPAGEASSSAAKQQSQPAARSVGPNRGRQESLRERARDTKCSGRRTC